MKRKKERKSDRRVKYKMRIIRNYMCVCVCLCACVCVCVRERERERERENDKNCSKTWVSYQRKEIKRSKSDNKQN